VASCSLCSRSFVSFLNSRGVVSISMPPKSDVLGIFLRMFRGGLGINIVLSSPFADVFGWLERAFPLILIIRVYSVKRLTDYEYNCVDVVNRRVRLVRARVCMCDGNSGLRRFCGSVLQKERGC